VIFVSFVVKNAPFVFVPSFLLCDRSLRNLVPS
jgi:hypothetical protein